MDERVGDPQQRRNFWGLDKAGEDELVLESVGRDLRLELFAKRTVTDEEKFGLRVAGDQVGRDGNQIIVAFECCQPCEFSNHEIFRSDSEPCAQRRVVVRCEERFEIKPAPNARELLRPAYARGQVLFGHGIGHGDEMSGVAASVSFGSPEQAVGQAPLKSSKGRPMDRVDDYRHSRLMSRQTAENARFAAVRMHDIRTNRLE